MAWANIDVGADETIAMDLRYVMSSRAARPVITLLTCNIGVPGLCSLGTSF
jgi:hypothetical protein